MKTGSRGFSLLETLLTLAMVFLVLGLAGQLVQRQCSLLSFSESKSNSLTSLQVALQMMLDETRQASSLLNPAPGGTSMDLDFTMIDPNAAWLPLPPFPAPTSWDPIGNATMLEVHYRLSNGDLIRSAGPATDLRTTRLATSVGGMQVDSVSTDHLALRIRLTLLENRRVLVISGLLQGPVI